MVDTLQIDILEDGSCRHHVQHVIQFGMGNRYLTVILLMTRLLTHPLRTFLGVNNADTAHELRLSLMNPLTVHQPASQHARPDSFSSKAS